MNLEPIVGSPFTVVVLTSPAYTEVANAASLATMTVGEGAFIEVQQLDAFGNAAQSSSAQQLQIQAVATHSEGNVQKATFTYALCSLVHLSAARCIAIFHAWFLASKF
jgi:hypothetical protein